MKSIESGFLDATLADVVYVDRLSPGLTGEALAEAVKFRVSAPLAVQLGKQFEVLASYDGPLTDYQGVVFKDKTDGTLYLAHRGTAGSVDIVADIDLALVSGVARDQVAAMVNWWNDIALPAGSSYRRVDSVSIGSPDPRTFIDGGAATAQGSIAAEVAAAAAAGKLRVVGHSLGGHLTTVFASLFHDQVSHSSTFNGAGLFSTPTLSATFAKMLLGTPLQQAAQLLGRVPRLPGADTQDNFHAVNGVDFTTNDLTFVQRGERVPVYNEYTSELSLAPIQNHFQYKLTDALALFRAFEQLEPGVGLDTLGGIAERGSVVQAASLEATLDALRRALQGQAVAPTPASDDGGDWKKSIMPQARIDFHQNLATLQESAAFRALAGKVEIAPVAAQGASAMADAARTDFGSFVALRDLSAFALRPATGVAGAEAALAGVWQTARGTEYAAWLADASARIDLDPDGTTQYSDAWYADRAAMLEWNLRRHAADGPPPEARKIAGAWRFDDRATGTSFDIAAPGVAYPRLSQIVFGSDAVGDVLAGDTLADRLYGGGGADTLTGDAGDDRLEGNAGSDRLDGGAGRDALFGGADDDGLAGGADDDRLDGGRGTDDLDGGTGNDALTGGLGGDTLAGGAGRDALDGGDGDDQLAGGVGDDLLRGGAGEDRYRFVAGDGDDRIEDADGRGRIDLGGNLLAGGAAVAPGLWRQGDVGYAFTPDADGSGDLTITSSGNRIVVHHFRPGTSGAAGDLGIALASYAAPALGSFHAVVGTASDDNSLDGIGGHVALAGTVGADRIQGLGGRDQLLGHAGDDLLEGGTQADVLSGGDGDDRLFADALLDVQAFADLQASLPGSGLQGDWLDGGVGNDELVGSVDADALFGGRGDDRIHAGAGNDFIFGDGEGAATDLGWHRVDHADGSYMLLPASYVLPTAGGADFIRAGGGDDIVNGDRGDDIVFGEAGADIITGFEGADQLAGGEGDDVLAGDEAGWFGVADAVGAADIIDGGAGNDVLRGNGGDDLLFGGAGDDNVQGGDGDDDIDGEDGDDDLDGDGGHDRIAGGAGDDVIRAGEGDDSVTGDDGADTLLGEAGNDRLDGGAHDDQIAGGDGDDVLAGGDGRDQLTGDAGADVIDGEDDDDGIWGGEGDDTLTGGAGRDRLAAGSGNDQVAGGEGDDVLWGEAGADGLAGSGGDDAIAGGDDDDALWGDAGDDGLWGDAGDDLLDGGAGHDLLDGGVGHDLLVGGAGGDRLVGGEGDDTLDGGAERDLLQGGAGNDTYLIDGAGDADLILDHEGANTYRLPSGVTLDNLDLRIGSDPSGAANHLVVVHGGRALAVLLGGYDPTRAPGLVLADGQAVSRWDMLARLARHADPATHGEPVAMAPPTGTASYVDEQHRLAASQAEHPVSFVTVELPSTQLLGGAGADHLVTLGATATLAGGAGDDELTGGYAADTLRGDAGDDRLTGNGGADLLEGGAGDDRLAGGPGADRLDGGEGADALDGDGDEDTLAGGAGDDSLRGGANRDRLEGGDGDDLLAGGDANDQLAGGAGVDALAGDEGDDILDGGAGDDTLEGGGGDDTLAGGAGDDLLRGGPGDDTYVVDGVGHDSLRDREGANVVRFAAGITDTSFTLIRGASGTADQDALVLDFGAGHSLTLADGLRVAGTQFRFDDGRAWTQAELLDRHWSAPLTLSATAADRVLSGGAGADVLGAAADTTTQLIGNRGDDALDGGAAADRLDGGAGADTLNGGGGADDLRGDDGNDLLAGGDGADLLRGGEGDDSLSGGAGDDRLFGGKGDDAYLLATGSGQDVVDDGGGRNTLRFAAGIDGESVAIRHDASDLLIALGDGSKTWIRGGWVDERISSLTFADGTSLTNAQLRARAQSLLPGEALANLGPAPVFGTAGDDTLTGGELFGDAGDDLLRGSGRFHFGRGDGADTIAIDPAPGGGSAGTPTVEIAPGMVREDLAFSRAGDDLVIALRGSADRLTVRDHFLAAQSLLGSSEYPSSIAFLRFADGTTLDRAAIGALVDATGTRDDDAVNAGAGGEGDDRLRLVGRAQDVHGGDGDDSLAADPHLPDDTSRLYGDAGNDVLVAGRGYYAATQLSGGSGDDVLHGASSATLDGGSGRNRLVIGNGPADDVFAAAAAGGSLAALPAGSRPQQLVLARDGGADYVTQQDTSLGSGRHDAFTVRMSAADYRDLTVGRDRDDLILGVRGRDARMTIADFFAAGAEHAGMQGLLVVQDDLGFAYLDPASPTADALAARAQPIAAAAVESSGTAGDDDLVGAGNADQLRGMAGDDRLDGLSGDDVLAGGDGDDVLIGRSGDDRLAGDDGDDTLIGGYGDDDLAGGEGADSLADAAGANRLDGGAGADTLRASGGSNALHGGDGDDLIVMLAGANAAEGGAGDDRINFLGGSADIDGGTGDDRIALAGAGTVTVRFGRGAGRDRVDGSGGGWAAGVDAEIAIGPGVTAADIAFTTQFNAGLQAEDFTLSIAGTSDRLTVEGGIRNGVAAVQTLRLASGEVLRVADLLAQPRSGTGGNDTLVGTAGNDFLSGLAGNDRLLGMAGDDRLDGGTGMDFMEGGAGNDVYVVDDRNDAVAESDDLGRDAGGSDEVQTSVSMILPMFVERLTMTGSEPLTAWGSAGDDILNGNAGGNRLDGQRGADRMAGGAGDDSYAVDDAGDQVVEVAGQGRDVVFATVSHALSAHVEDLWVSTDTAADGTGNELANDLHGGNGANTLSGRGGDDTLDGGAGADTLIGGAGDDLYVVDEAGDSVVEAADEGSDSVQSWVSMSLADGVENLQLLGGAGGTAVGNALDNRLVGGSGNDRLDGGGGTDTLEGGIGTDTYVLRAGGGIDTVIDIPVDADLAVVAVDAGLAPADLRIDREEVDGRSALVVSAHDGADALRFVDFGAVPYDLVVRFGDGSLWDSATVQAKIGELRGTEAADLITGGPGADRMFGLGGDDVLRGAAGDDLLDGGDGDDVLDGEAGTDTLQGGRGDDRYLAVAADDHVIEHADEGIDTVETATSHVLASGVESLVFTGLEAVDGTGNEQDNRLTGNAAANTLDGGGGQDVTEGGAGDDTHLVDSAADVVIERDGEGVDTVIAGASFALPAAVEHLVLAGAAGDGTGNVLDNTVTGNELDNRLDGGPGADSLRGGAGDDTYVVDAAGDRVFEQPGAGSDTVLSSISYVLPVDVERLTLIGTAPIAATGNAAANVLTGNGAANALDGGAGADNMSGGVGDDSYRVDHAGDVVVEAAAAGTDTITASVSFVLPAHVEQLLLAGAAAINGTGNALANVLVGNAADNVLKGGAGSDVLRGGAGNDTFIVDVTGDTVVENAGEGTDVVKSAVGWTLGANVENLTLTGSAAINGTGNALANVLVGNAANNVLNGRAGADTLRGGGGNDVYLVDQSGDVVVEAAAAGEDAVQSAVSHALAANVEHLTLTGAAAINGTGNVLANALAGNDAANGLAGGDGNDLLWGGGGNDTLAGGNGVDLLQGGTGDDLLSDASGNGLLDGGVGNDTLGGSTAREFIAGGAGADSLTTGGGADVIAFNRGGGADVVNASTGSDDTLSLGGGIAYADLKLRKTGLDLVLDAGAGDQITFRNWYQTGVNQKSVVNLQAVADAMAEYDAAGSDRQLNKRVVNFNFSGIVDRFDAARAADPLLTSFSVGSALADFYVSGSDTAAIGGDLAYDYGHRNALTDIGMGAAQAIVAATGFGVAAQSLQSFATLHAGTQRLR